MMVTPVQSPLINLHEIIRYKIILEFNFSQELFVVNYGVWNGFELIIEKLYQDQ